LDVLAEKNDITEIKEDNAKTIAQLLSNSVMAKIMVLSIIDIVILWLVASENQKDNESQQPHKRKERFHHAPHPTPPATPAQVSRKGGLPPVGCSSFFLGWKLTSATGGYYFVGLLMIKHFGNAFWSSAI